MAPRMLAGLLAALLIAALAEVACFAALAMNESAAGTFYISTLGAVVVAYSGANASCASQERAPSTERPASFWSARHPWGQPWGRGQNSTPIDPL
jgi:hypothetical protein